MAWLVVRLVLPSRGEKGVDLGPSMIYPFIRIER